jgi:23S rRNA (adenine2030-N6)-methyltransferase
VGRYDLRSDAARRHAEFREGIDRLRDAARRDPAIVPADVGAYLGLVDAALRDPVRAGYPGSSDIAVRVLRPTDRLVLAELHPADAAAATRLFARVPHVTVVGGDGYECLKRYLPPREGRGVVVIDPAFEVRSEPDRVIGGMRDALARFRHGTYLIWYPRAGKLDWPRFVERVTRLAPPQLAHATLGAPGAQGGAIASGVLLINPPYSARDGLERTHAWLVDRVASGAGEWQWVIGSEAP